MQPGVNITRLNTPEAAFSMKKETLKTSLFMRFSFEDLEAAFNLRWWKFTLMNYTNSLNFTQNYRNLKSKFITQEKSGFAYRFININKILININIIITSLIDKLVNGIYK